MAGDERAIGIAELNSISFSRTSMETSVSEVEQATFGTGCFWCTEAVFSKMRGIKSAVSGYMGGIVENPTYQDVCTGLTQHAEVVQLAFNPDDVSYEEILDVFWVSHDPTTLNRQGQDVGTQYRSVIFYHSERQREIAENSKISLQRSGTFDDSIVTEITAATTFYPAEEYHQAFYRRNPQHQYCRLVIDPKLKKLDFND